MKDSFAVDGSTLWTAIVIETMWSSLRAGPIMGPPTTHHSTQTFLRAHGNSATTLNGDLQGSTHFLRWFMTVKEKVAFWWEQISPLSYN